MALDDTTNSTAPVSTSAPTPAPSPAPDAPQPSAPLNPALSGLVVPGPNAASVAQTLAPQYAQREADAYQKASDIANAPTAPPPPGPHARLLSMVQGFLQDSIPSAKQSLRTAKRVALRR